MDEALRQSNDGVHCPDCGGVLEPGYGMTTGGWMKMGENVVHVCGGLGAYKFCETCGVMFDVCLDEE